MANLSCGIVGLPNVGKSTLFNALTRGKAASSNYPFCTIDPNVGVVDVFDPRLEVLGKIANSKKIVYATMQFVDIAGLVKGASKGEGLGNKFLSHIREMDAIIHIVRCFEGDDVVHVDGTIDPIRDIETIKLELILSDIQSLENIISRVGKQSKGNKDLIPTIDCLKKVNTHLNENKPVHTLELTEEEQKILKPYPLLTNKKVLYVANVSENDVATMTNPYIKQIEEHAKKEGNSVISISAQIESEISQFSKEEEAEFLKELGLQESGLNKLIHASFKLLNLITYITTGEIETRAWTITEGMTAPQAAGKIHTDIQQGFIRAETASVDDIIKYNGRQGVKEAGKMRCEGKEYVVQDDNVILFLHN